MLVYLLDIKCSSKRAQQFLLKKKPKTNKKPCPKLHLGQDSGSLYLPAHISKLPGEASKAKKKSWTVKDGARFELTQAWNKIYISFSFGHFSDTQKYLHACKLTSSTDLYFALCTCMLWEAGFVQRITCFLSKKNFSVQEMGNTVGQIYWKEHTATKKGQLWQHHNKVIFEQYQTIQNTVVL